MKKLLLTLALLFLPSLAFAQCNGVFPASSVCGTNASGPNIPSAQPISNFAASISGFPAQAAKTANYSAAFTDCNTTLVLGTGTTAQFTLTLPALPATGFNAGCTIIAKNADVWSGIGTGHAMTLVGFPAEFTVAGTACSGNCLWPTHAIMVTVNSAGTGWVIVSKPGRWLTPGIGNSIELCYTQNGSDVNDGLGSGTGCLAHVQTAVNTIGTLWDGGGYNACAIGIYTGGTNQINEAVAQTGQSIGCYLTVNFRGAVTWATAGSCWNSGDNGITILNMNLGFVPTLHCNNTNLVLTCQFYGHQAVVWDINGSFEWDPQGTNDCLHLSDAYGRATYGLSTIVVGTGAAASADSFFNCNSMCLGMQVSGTIAHSANVTYNMFFRAQNGGYILTNASITGSPTVTNPSKPVGYGRLITNGTTIPGGTTPAAACPPAQNTSFGLVMTTNGC
jgi:hypothetical protein